MPQPVGAAKGLITLLDLSSFIELYSTGTTSIVRISIVMPPNTGMAIGTIMSEPLPVEVNTGISARIVVAVVIRHGRTLRVPAFTTFWRISAKLLGFEFLKLCSRYVHITTPSSEASPNRAKNPTHIATLILIG